MPVRTVLTLVEAVEPIEVEMEMPAVAMRAVQTLVVRIEAAETVTLKTAMMYKPVVRSSHAVMRMHAILTMRAATIHAIPKPYLPKPSVTKPSLGMPAVATHTRARLSVAI
jgi:hypothetical protein